MSFYLGRSDHPEYRRDHEGDEDRGRESARGRRQGESRRGSSGSDAWRPRSPHTSRPSSSSRRARSRHGSPSRIGHTSSPPDRKSQAAVSSEPRSPYDSQMKPAHSDRGLVSSSKNPKPDTTIPRTKTRDPRLLKRIDTSNSVTTGNISSASNAESPSMPMSALDRSTDASSDAARPDAIRRIEQVLPGRHRLSSLSTSDTFAEPNDDPANVLATILGSLFENASSSAVLKFEHSKVKAKAAHQENNDKKMGALSKSFPAFAEASAKARSEIDKDLAALNQNLAEHQKVQAGFLAAVPDIFRASKTSRTSNKEREQMELVQRCISLCEEFKFNVKDLKDSFEKQKSVASKIEQEHLEMHDKIRSSTTKVHALSLQLESIQARCCDLGEKHTELEVVSKASSEETRKSFAAINLSLERGTERDEQQQTVIENAENTIGELSRRLGLLESQQYNLAETMTLQDRRTKEVQELAEDHESDLQKMKSTTFSNEQIDDTVRSIGHDIQELRETLSDVQNRKTSAPLDTQELSSLKTDIAALKEELVKLIQEKPALKDMMRRCQELLPNGVLSKVSNANEDTTREGQSQLTELEHRLNSCVRDIEGLHQTLDEKQTEEDTRDEVIAAQLEEIKGSILKAKEVTAHRIEVIESEIKKQRVEDLNKAQKVQDSFIQLFKAGNQLSNSNISLPSAPPTPQMQLPSVQAASSSPQPMMQMLAVEINRRLESVEKFLSTMRQQFEAVSMALQQLDQRYNNLTTEPIVRAMVHQMQIIYPYASDAQREIANLKQLIAPFKDVIPQMKNLTMVVNNHSTTLGSISDFEHGIAALEKERFKNDARHEKLVEHVKEERGKLIDEVERQKETADGIAKRIDVLEDDRKDEPDKLEYLARKVADKLQAESTKTMQDIAERLDLLESNSRRHDLFDSRRKDLLRAFTATTPAPVTAGRVRDLQDDDTDDSSIPLSVKTNGQKSKVSSLSAPSGLGKTFMKSRTNSISKKRKRYGNPENNDRSDDDTYVPAVQSSPARRKLRGSE